MAWDGSALEFASEELQGNREIVTSAVTICSHALRFASVPLRGDKQVVLQAMATSGRALRFASREMQDDHDVIKLAVETAGAEILEHASKRSRGHKALMADLIGGRPMCLRWATGDVTDDVELIRQATLQLPWCFNYGTEAVRSILPLMAEALHRLGDRGN